MNKDWLELLKEAFAYFMKNISPALDGDHFYPAQQNIFRAFKECPLNELKVVILGQDPYIKPREATGLSFDVNSGTKIPPSLLNVIREMGEDIPEYIWSNQPVPEGESYLGYLPSQGVLLLNTALTVLSGQSGSHTELWKPFTKLVIEALNSKDDLVWILWGNHSKSFKQYITNPTHVFIEGGHPSPLNTSKEVPFKGGKYFSRCNEILKSKNKAEIRW